MAFAAVALLGARLAPGVDVIAEITDLDARLAGADLVIVGEGALDTQSLRGRGPVGVTARARGLPVVAVVGQNPLTEPEWRAAGLSAVYALTDLERDVEVCVRNVVPLLRELASRSARDWLPS